MGRADRHRGHALFHLLPGRELPPGALSNPIGCHKQDNVFLWLEDVARARKRTNRVGSVGGVALLQRYADTANPLLNHLLAPMAYDWVTAHSDYATDLVFTSRQALQDFFPRLLEYSTLCFTATDVMTCLGRKFHGKCEGEMVTDRVEHEIRGRDTKRLTRPTLLEMCA